MSRAMSTPLRAIAAALATVALTACSSDSTGSAAPEETFSFGEADVKSVVTGDFKGTLTLTGKPPTALTLHLDKAPASTTKAACGNRTLVHEQCISVSTMMLVGTLSTDDKTYEGAAVTATFDVYGTELRSGSLRIVAGSRTLNVSFDNGAFKSGTVQEGGNAAGELTLTR